MKTMIPSSPQKRLKLTRAHDLNKLGPVSENYGQLKCLEYAIMQRENQKQNQEEETGKKLLESKIRAVGIN